MCLSVRLIPFLIWCLQALRQKSQKWRSESNSKRCWRQNCPTDKRKLDKSRRTTYYVREGQGRFGKGLYDVITPFQSVSSLTWVGWRYAFLLLAAKQVVGSNHGKMGGARNDASHTDPRSLIRCLNRCWQAMQAKVEVIGMAVLWQSGQEVEGSILAFLPISYCSNWTIHKLMVRIQLVYLMKNESFCCKEVIFGFPEHTRDHYSHLEAHTLKKTLMKKNKPHHLYYQGHTEA